MFSIQKIVVFAIIIAALWIGFRLVSNMDKKRKAEERQSRRARVSWRDRFRGRGQPQGGAGRTAGQVEMAACRQCGDYVPAAGAKGCGKADCPYPPTA
ncbi:MAG: hypothetical protein AAF563_10810 [Pseudomonadota bacterium]